MKIKNINSTDDSRLCLLTLNCPFTPHNMLLNNIRSISLKI